MTRMNWEKPLTTKAVLAYHGPSVPQDRDWSDPEAARDARRTGNHAVCVSDRRWRFGCPRLGER
jgi:hypothetical protein